LRLFLVLILFVSSLASQADSSAISSTLEQSKQTIVWSIIPYAPIHILEGDYKGQGIVDEYIINAQNALPGYLHTNQIMTPARTWYQMSKNEQLVCYPSALKTTEREAFAYFTQPGLITPVLRVVMREDMWKKEFAGRDSINIKEYIANNKKNFGVVSKRSYGEEIDHILSKVLRGENDIIQTSGRYGSRQLYQMLLSERIDIMLEYPWVTAYFEKVLKNDSIKVVHLIIEGLPKYTAAYVACTRNDDGKKVIEALDKFLAKEVLNIENRQRMMRWLGKKEAEAFEQDYLEYFNIEN
tara:strand:- start:119 stop:1009 length:891 start_codon:yes stop_codon:yes gene_type:complete